MISRSTKSPKRLPGKMMVSNSKVLRASKSFDRTFSIASDWSDDACHRISNSLSISGASTIQTRRDGLSLPTPTESLGMEGALGSHPTQARQRVSTAAILSKNMDDLNSFLCPMHSVLFYAIVDDFPADIVPGCQNPWLSASPDNSIVSVRLTRTAKFGRDVSDLVAELFYTDKQHG